MSKLSWVNRMGFPNLGQPYKFHGVWCADDEETGERLFVPNRCCKCCVTTNSQNDRFCDDCYAVASWYEKYPLHQLMLMAVGFLAIIKMLLEWM